MVEKGDGQTGNVLDAGRRQDWQGLGGVGQGLDGQMSFSMAWAFLFEFTRVH